VLLWKYVRGVSGAMEKKNLIEAQKEIELGLFILHLTPGYHRSKTRFQPWVKERFTLLI